MKHAKHIILVFAVMAALAANASGQVQVSAQIESGKDIYVGEGFTFYIVIQGSDKAGKVDLEPLRQYNPQSMGNRNGLTRNGRPAWYPSNLSLLALAPACARRPDAYEYGGLPALHAPHN